jgi:hypothetical protein
MRFQKAADPSNLQLLHLKHVSSLQASRVHNYTLQHGNKLSQEESLIITNKFRA